MKPGLWMVILLLAFSVGFAQMDSLVVQEQQLGLCTLNGTIVTASGSISGWTGPGFIDVENGVGKAVSWEVFIQSEGEYLFTWRYAFGGLAANMRDAKLIIDGNTAADTVFFPYTTSWSNWAEVAPVQVHLAAGDHKIRLEAVRSGGLANLDYLKVYGQGVTAWECTPQYTLTVAANDTSRGSISYSPKLSLYDKGTLITLHAVARPGYFFQSWTGEEPSADSVCTFAIKSDVAAVARFLPETVRTRIDTTIIGYATVQDDKGTPFLVTGGSEGEAVQATTLEELQFYLGSELPYVVEFMGEIADSTQLIIKSNKTLIGAGPLAHLRGVELAIKEARNVIIRNLTISGVRDAGATNDAMSINGASQNIVIDRCEFFSDRDHDKDYYDGLLDIKNQSRFITVSNCYFHDHWKAILISSGDTQYADSLIRITLHHNWFCNIGSRLPLIRFGKAHIFNNYYQNCDDAINTRMGACVRVECNCFDTVKKAIFSDYSAAEGCVQLIGNQFGSASYITAPPCELVPPYPYAHRMQATELLPALIPARAGTHARELPADLSNDFTAGQVFPNPFNSATVLRYSLPASVMVRAEVYDLLGRKVATLVNERQRGEQRVVFTAGDLPSGIYILSLRAGNSIVTRKALLLR